MRRQPAWLGLFGKRTNVVDDFPALRIGQLVLECGHGTVAVRDFPEQLAIGHAAHLARVCKIRRLRRKLAGAVAVSVAIYAVAAFAVLRVVEHAIVDGRLCSRNRILHFPRRRRGAPSRQRIERDYQRDNENKRQRDDDQSALLVRWMGIHAFPRDLLKCARKNLPTPAPNFQIGGAPAALAPE